MTRDDCIFLGSIAKAYGVKGEVIIRLIQGKAPRKSNLELVFIEIDGLLVPFFISDIRQNRLDELIVLFDDIGNKPAAEKLTGKKVFVPLSMIDQHEPEINKNSLKDYNVVDKTAGEIGKIIGVIDIPGNPLIQVQYRNTKVYIPLQEQFILKFDPENKTILFSLPPGLLEI